MADEPIKPDISLLAEIPDKDLEEIVASIKEGAKQPGDALGFGTEALNAIEQMAVGFFRSQLYDKASVIYGFVLQMNNGRTSAWRGLGACAHALKLYQAAIECYRGALFRDAGDLVSQVYLGECLCHVGNKDEGLEILKAVIDKGTKEAAYLPYITRARAVVSADGGVPTRLVLKQAGKALAQEAAEAIAEGEAPVVDQEGVDLDAQREIQWEDMKKDPELAKVLGELSKAVEDGTVTFAEVGGFTANELDGAYACACKYAEMGQVLEAIQIAGYLMFLDPYNPRYFQLVGICMQRLKQYEHADFYYTMAQSLDAEDARTLVYRGESKIMAGKTDDGLALIKKGIEAAAGKPDLKEVSERGEILVRQFGA